MMQWEIVSRRERERRIEETSIRALPLQHLIKERHHIRGGNDPACPSLSLPLMWPQLPSPLRLHPQQLPPIFLLPLYPQMLPLEPTMDLRVTAHMVYWISLRWGVLHLPLSLWVLFVTQFKMYCSRHRDIYMRRLQLQEVLTQCNSHQRRHLWTWMNGPSMIWWGDCWGWVVF